MLIGVQESRRLPLPVMVVLVDDGDGSRVQVDPEEVGPHLHAALQPVAFLDTSQLAVHSVHTHCACWEGGALE